MKSPWAGVPSREEVVRICTRLQLYPDPNKEPEPNATCEHCGKPYRRVRNNQRFCLEVCKQNYDTAQRTLRRQTEPREMRTCARDGCSTTFPKNGRKVYCCDECREIDEKALERVNNRRRYLARKAACGATEQTKTTGT